MNSDMDKYVAALDIGTTMMKCHIYSKDMVLTGCACCKINVLHPEENYEEIDPNDLWDDVVNVVNNAIRSANIKTTDLKCIGISTQRNSFVTWDRMSGKYFHNFITWRDRRAESYVCFWNCILTFVGYLIFCVFLVVRSQHLLLISRFRFTNYQLTMRLRWQLCHCQILASAVASRTAIVAPMSTWLVYRLTGGAVYALDMSSASATGMYDPFMRTWSALLYVLGVPKHVLPPVCDCGGEHFGVTSTFGPPIQIACCMTDQAAALLGSCCFNASDIKVTLGTGGYFGVNNGCTIKSYPEGMWPLVCWKKEDEIIFMTEAGFSDCATVINWAQTAGFFQNISDLSKLTVSINDANHVYFIPSFIGLQFPFEDTKATSGFLGLKPSSTKEHMLKSILKSIVFRVYEIFAAHSKVHKIKNSVIRVNGGVAKNDFICQLMADICDATVARYSSVEMSACGVAFQAGVVTGMWRSMEELRNFQTVEQTFVSNFENGQKLRNEFEKWKLARKRFLKWKT